ncbi:MAG: branched-chain amino acid aminotransferase [Candidatus Thorarchaeota archaeon]
MDIEINKVNPELLKTKPSDISSIPFGTLFTDHMLLMEFKSGVWQTPRIEPYRPLSIDPAALVLHYGQGIFEGLKAYRRGDNIYLFRTERNLERMNASAKRMVMPEIDTEQVLASLKELLKIERDWIPDAPGTSLYIRPTMIATEPKLGVRPSEEYLFYIILSPVGPYFKQGFTPIDIMIAERHVRAAEGGVGAAKTMGNYAASLYAGTESRKLGYSQVLWLDAAERKYLEEVGTMNIVVVLDDEVATPSLGGTILSGITRDTVMQLAQTWEIPISERKISVDEVTDGIKTGKVKEMFGCGTAAIIAPVGHLYYKGTRHTVSDGSVGDLTRRFYDTIVGMQCGKVDDPYGWVIHVE